jgi:hypothetical protein
MKITIVTGSYLLRKMALLLCLLCSLVVSACASPSPSTPTPTLTPTLTLIPIPTIVPSRPCTLSPGATIPMAVMGVSGAGVVYSWSASAGTVIPPDGPTVTYTAPNQVEDVIITVVAQKGDQTSTGMITCKIEATPTPNPTATYTPSPTATHTPSPTATSTATPSRTPPPATPLPPLCEGSTSSELIGKAWAGDPQTRLACAQLIIDRWTDAADKQQDERVKSNICTITPDLTDAKAVEKFNASYWAVNDVGTAWFLRGEALKSLGRTTEARAAYATVIDKYSCAYSLSADGKSFWRIADAAK